MFGIREWPADPICPYMSWKRTLFLVCMAQSIFCASVFLQMVNIGVPVQTNWVRLCTAWKGNFLIWAKYQIKPLNSISQNKIDFTVVLSILQLDKNINMVNSIRTWWLFGNIFRFFKCSILISKTYYIVSRKKWLKWVERLFKCIRSVLITCISKWHWKISSLLVKLNSAIYSFM